MVRDQSGRDKTKVFPTCLALPASVVEGGTVKVKADAVHEILGAAEVVSNPFPSG